jgi:hypothetical protein
MSTMTFVRWAAAGLLGVAAIFSAAPPAAALTCTPPETSLSCEDTSVPATRIQLAERKGHTASDGPGSPYTDARKKKKSKKKDPSKTSSGSSNNRFICEQNCPFPSGSARMEQCIQKCLDRFRNAPPRRAR